MQETSDHVAVQTENQCEESVDQLMVHDVEQTHHPESGGCNLHEILVQAAEHAD